MRTRARFEASVAACVSRCAGILAFVAIWVATTALAADEPTVIHLWDGGAPGFESRRDEPEVAREYWVRNIHNPSITVFPAPKDKANGVGILVVPGGGHRELVFKAEGVEPAQYLNGLGITAFVLKH